MNRLSQSKSPYLRQHAHNPVDWYPWGEEVLKRAREEQKWIFLSIGYSSCHWCHVMERESFEDAGVAAFLNEHFLSVKVDREERPDIDAVYMEAVQMIAGHGGWPLSVWLTPDLVPIYGGTYFPPVDTHQRPSFSTVLRRLVEIRSSDPDTVLKRTIHLRSALQRDIYASLPEANISQETIEDGIRDYSNRFDADFGGFSGAPKFPQAMGLRFLLLAGDKQARQMALHTLRSLLRGGIWDAVGGGLHRYSTDHRWLVPHFEKMLYDQATLLDALSIAQSRHPEPLFESAISDLLHFLQRDMQHPKGGFYSALDADTQGVEGLTYLWTDRELDETLEPEELELARIYYGIEPGGNWEGHHILVRPLREEDVASACCVDVTLVRAKMERIRGKLLARRLQRPQPSIDHKVLTSWNALLLSALIDTGLRNGSSLALDMAYQLGAFLSTALCSEGVYRTCYDGAWEQVGFLDDVAFMAQACFRLYGLKAEPEWLERGVHLVETIRNHYYDHENAAFWYTMDSHGQPLSKSRDVFDNALPSATSAAIGALCLAYRYTGDRNYDHLSRGALSKLATVMAEHGTAFGTALQWANSTVRGWRELVVVGPNPEPFVEVWRAYDQGDIVLLVDAQGTGKGPLLEGRAPKGGTTYAWLCRDGACELPVQKSESLVELLKK